MEAMPAFDYMVADYRRPRQSSGMFLSFARCIPSQCSRVSSVGNVDRSGPATVQSHRERSRECNGICRNFALRLGGAKPYFLSRQHNHQRCHSPSKKVHSFSLLLVNFKSTLARQSTNKMVREAASGRAEPCPNISIFAVSLIAIAILTFRLSPLISSIPLPLLRLAGTSLSVWCNRRTRISWT